MEWKLLQRLSGGEKLMALFDDLNAQEQEISKQGTEGQKQSQKDRVNGGLPLAFVAILVPVYVIASYFWGDNVGLTCTICLGTNVVAIGICWDLSKHLWFWGVMFVVLALHVPLILMVHWPDYWIPGIALLPIGLVDVLIIVKVVRFVEKFIVKSPATDEKV
jgi:hypothetical protein